MSEQIPKAALKYAALSLQADVYRVLVYTFAKKAATDGLTLDIMAARLGWKVAKLEKLFAAPGDWTLDIISDIALSMECEVGFKIVPWGAPIPEQPQQQAVAP